MASGGFGELAGIFKETRKHLMNGVSYMVPFVVASGVILAASVAMYGQGGVPTEGTWLNQLFFIGASGMGLMVPILSAYIAASIADRAGIAPGAIGGAVANTIGAGFLGGMFSGLLAGVVCYYLKKIKLPPSLRSLLPIIIIPICGTVITASIMQWVIGAPIAGIMNVMTNFLTSLSDGNKVLLGIACGAMSAFDMGGPINKVSFAFAVGTVSSGIYTYAGGSAVAVCVPPLGMALATILAPKKYTSEEREAGKGAFAMGLVGITEGAIPFAANDPLRVIPALMIGDAIGVSVAFLLNVTCKVAWGGLIVAPVVGNVFGFLLAIVVGMFSTAVIVNFLKKPVDTDSTKGVASTKASAGEELELSFD